MNKNIAKSFKKIQFLQRTAAVVYYILSKVFCFVIQFYFWKEVRNHQLTLWNSCGNLQTLIILFCMIHIFILDIFKLIIKLLLP